MNTGYYTPVWLPFGSPPTNENEGIFNWKIKSEHMPEIYMGNTSALKPWRMELRFMVVDIERQLRGIGGIKEWSSCHVPDLEGPQIKPLDDGWVRTFTFSEYLTGSYGTRLTGDWLVKAKVWSNNYEELFNFDVRSNAGVHTVDRLSGREKLMSWDNQTRWRNFYPAESRPPRQIEVDPISLYYSPFFPTILGYMGSPVYNVAQARDGMLRGLMDNDARSLFPVCPQSERGHDSSEEHARDSVPFSQNSRVDLNEYLGRLSLAGWWW